MKDSIDSVFAPMYVHIVPRSIEKSPILHQLFLAVGIHKDGLCFNYLSMQAAVGLQI